MAQNKCTYIYAPNRSQCLPASVSLLAWLCAGSSLRFFFGFIRYPLITAMPLGQNMSDHNYPVFFFTFNNAKILILYTFGRRNHTIDFFIIITFFLIFSCIYLSIMLPLIFSNGALANVRYDCFKIPVTEMFTS